MSAVPRKSCSRLATLSLFVLAHVFIKSFAFLQVDCLERPILFAELLEACIHVFRAYQGRIGAALTLLDKLVQLARVRCQQPRVLRLLHLEALARLRMDFGQFDAPTFFLTLLVAASEQASVYSLHLALLTPLLPLVQ